MMAEDGKRSRQIEDNVQYVDTVTKKWETSDSQILDLNNWYPHLRQRNQEEEGSILLVVNCCNFYYNNTVIAHLVTAIERMYR